MREEPPALPAPLRQSLGYTDSFQRVWCSSGGEREEGLTYKRTWQGAGIPEEVKWVLSVRELLTRCLPSMAKDQFELCS